MERDTLYKSMVQLNDESKTFILARLYGRFEMAELYEQSISHRGFFDLIQDQVNKADKTDGCKEEKVIQSVDFIEQDNIFTLKIGQEFSGEEVADIVKCDDAFMLYNRQDRLITEIKLPVFSITFGESIKEEQLC